MKRQRKRRGVGAGRILLRLVCGLVFAFLMLPLLVLFPISFSSGTYLRFPPPGFSLKWYARYFDDPPGSTPPGAACRSAAATTVLALLIGIPLAFGLVRGRFRGRALIENGISAPIIVPHIVLSIAIYGLFSRLGLIGEWYGMAVAHTVLALPFVVIVLLAGLRDFDVNLELAARGLGAGRFAAVRTVTLPILAPSVYSAAFLAFITSFDELVVAMFISGANMTLPKKMFDNIMSEIEPTVAAVSAHADRVDLGAAAARNMAAPSRQRRRSCASNIELRKGRPDAPERHPPQGLQGDALLVGGLQACHRRSRRCAANARVSPSSAAAMPGSPAPSSWPMPASTPACSRPPSSAPAPARAAAAASAAASTSARASPARCSAASPRC